MVIVCCYPDGGGIILDLGPPWCKEPRSGLVRAQAGDGETFRCHGHDRRGSDIAVRPFRHSQCRGLASPSADDSIIGRGVVNGRAATILRSIETHPCDRRTCLSPERRGVQRGTTPNSPSRQRPSRVYSLVLVRWV